MIVTIDGPAASGKSTAARLLAERLGFAYLDTGAMYRAVTVAAMRGGVDMADPGALAAFAEKLDIDMDSRGSQVRVDGEDVTEAIRKNEVSRYAGMYVAPNEGVRHVLVGQQRQIAEHWGDLVTEGRDQGSVVFPDAELKVYLGCSVEERARRRQKELASRGQEVPYDQVVAELQTRDESDQARRIGPLKPPDGSINFDTEGKTIEETVEYLVKLVEMNRKGGM